MKRGCPASFITNALGWGHLPFTALSPLRTERSHGDFGTEGGHMVTCFWILTLLGSLIGGLIVFGTLVSAKGAPQEAAGAALGLSFAIIP